MIKAVKASTAATSICSHTREFCKFCFLSFAIFALVFSFAVRARIADRALGLYLAVRANTAAPARSLARLCLLQGPVGPGCISM